MAHANLSPSKRHRWGVCPGSIREEAKYPEQAPGPAAIDGTHSHSLLESCIKNGLMDPTILVGQTMNDHEGEFKVDADRAARVKVAIDYIRSRVSEHNGLCEVISEETVDPKWILGRSDLFGTVDCQIWGSKVYEIIDYKDGMGIVSAEGNLQIEQYALGVLSKFKLAQGDPFPFDTVRGTIIQPKLALKGMPAVVSFDVSVEDLMNRRSVILAEAKATDDPNAPLVPGEKQCKFCRAKGGCSALAGNVMKEVGLMFQPINPSFPGDKIIQPVMSQQLDLAQQSANKDPGTMTPDQIRQILEAAPLVRQFIEGVEAEALRRLQAGIPVPGFKLVRGRGSRSWSLPEDQMAERLIKMGIPKSEVYKSSLVSPAQAEKLTWTKKNGEKVQLTERQLKKLNEEYITSNGGKMTIAPESDNREAIVTDASAMFAPVGPLVEPQSEFNRLQSETTGTPSVSATPAESALPAWLM